MEDLAESFFKACTNLPDNVFVNKRNRRFNIALFEAVFAVACGKPFANRIALAKILAAKKIEKLEGDEKVLSASQLGTTKTVNVKARLKRARELVGEL